MQQFASRGKCSHPGCKKETVEGGEKCQLHTKPGQLRGSLKGEDLLDEGMAYIYAIQCEDFIKFGQTRSPKARFSSLKGSTPFELKYLGDVVAPSSLEFAIHRYLELDRHKLEWFRLSKRVKRVVNMITRGEAVKLAKTVGLCDVKAG